jgi:hypothetical protein
MSISREVPYVTFYLTMLPMSPHVWGGAYGLAAAALFGMSPPIAKLLLPEADPTPFRRTPVWWSWPRVAWL